MFLIRMTAHMIARYAYLRIKTTNLEDVIIFDLSLIPWYSYFQD